MNITVASLRTAIEGIPDWTKSGANALEANSAKWLIDNRGTFGHYRNALAVSNNGTERMSISSTGYVGIATSPTSPATQTLGASNGTAPELIANATIAGTNFAGNTTGDWVNNSDFRLKNIESLPFFTDKLMQIRPVTFEWKDPTRLGATEGKYIGLIASTSLSRHQAYGQMESSRPQR